MSSKDSCSIFQVIGYKNSGKTTLVSQLVKHLTKEGFAVGTLKHHGHGGSPIISDEGTDSEKHRLAGALISGVEGDGTLQLHINQKSRFELAELLLFYQLLPLDCLVLEGFKGEHYPKVILLRDEKDMNLLQECHNIVGVITWKDMNLSCHVPCFNINQNREYLPFIIEEIKRRL